MADFDGPDTQKYRVSDTIVSNLKSVLEGRGIRVEPLGYAITPANGGRAKARREGGKLRASVVIWGWYGLTPVTAPVSVNLELLRSPLDFDNVLCPSERGRLRAMSRDALYSFSLQSKIADEMAYLVLMAAGLASYSAENWLEAVERFGEALEVGGAKDLRYSGLIHVLRGDSYYFLGKNFYAVSDYSAGVRLGFPELAYPRLGDAYRHIENYREAISAYTEDLKIEPDSTRALYGRGAAQESLGNMAGALSDYRRALTVDGERTLALAVRECCSGQPDAAIEELAGKIERQPNHLLARFVRAYFWVLQKKYTLALPELQAVASELPSSGIVHFYIAVAHEKVGHLREAEASFGRAISINTDRPCNYISRGWLYYDQGSIDAARADFDRAVKVGPESEHAYFSRGNFRELIGEHGAALSDYARAVELDPEDRDNRLARARMLLWTGHVLAAYRDARLLFPGRQMRQINAAIIGGGMISLLVVLLFFWSLRRRRRRRNWQVVEEEVGA